MRRNWYALLLLMILAIFLSGSAAYVRGTADGMRRDVGTAHASALLGDYDGARRAFEATALAAKRQGFALRLFVRRTLVDKVDETLAVLPHYAEPDNAADLAVEAARAVALIDQMEASFFGGA